MWLFLGSALAAAPSIPYEKLELDNGLDVILAPDHSIPFVQVNIWYHVGSRNEVTGRTGFAHLFEHLMFQGSEHSPGEYFEPLQRVGAQINGTTNLDRTNFFEGIPSNQLPLALYMESDRMGWLLPALDDAKLSNQKDVVRNERRERYENRPYGMAWPWLLEACYPDGHPYHTATIGKHEDLEAATLEDVKTFFQKWYGPNNASLVITGDFEPRDVRPMVEEWFGDIPMGPKAPKQKIKPVKLASEVVVRKESDVPFPHVWMAWHTPAMLKAGDAELDLLSHTLSDGKDSRLYRKLVRELQIAQDVSAYQGSQLLQSLFIIDATAQPGHTSDELVAAVDSVLADLRVHPVTQDEMAVARTSFEVSFFDGISTIAGKANLLNNYNFLKGDPGYIEEDLARYQDASAANVQAAFKKYIGAERVVLHINPLAKTGCPVMKPVMNAAPKLALFALLFSLPALAVDRSKAPGPTEPRPFVLPAPTEGALQNGIRVQVVESHELPFVWVTLAFTAGSADDPAGQEGLAEITMDMLNEGAGSYDAVALSAALKRLGSDLGGSAGPDGGSVGVRSLSRQLGPTLDLMSDVVKQPTFPASEWDILKKQYLASLQTNRSDPSRIASRTMEKVLHGDTYRGREMTEASIGAIDVAGMKAWYETHLGPENATLLVGGDTTLAAILPELEKRFGSWKAKAATPAPLAAPVAIPKSTLYVVDKPGAAQSVILAGRYIGQPTAADYHALMVAHQAMGGQFSSRINLNLREKNGYTYGARTTLGYNRLGVRFGVSTSVKTDVTGPAMKELLYELRGPTEGRAFADTEVADARDAIVSAWPLRFESPGYLLGQLENIWRYNLPADWVATYEGKVRAVSATEAEKAWQTHLSDGAGGLLPLSWVVVGDLSKTREGLAGLGLTMVELDVDGKKK